MKNWHFNDSLLKGISFQEIIDTVHSNEQEHDPKAVEKVFNEILELQVADAREILRAHMKEILSSLNPRSGAV